MVTKRQLEDENSNLREENMTLRGHVNALEEELAGAREYMPNAVGPKKAWILEEICRAAEMAVNRQRVRLSRPSNRLEPVQVISKKSKIYNIEEIDKHFRANASNVVSIAMWNKILEEF